MVGQPAGTVTLLFTDVEGSTRLLAELGPERYSTVLGLHRRVLRDAFAAHGGYEVDEEGDALFVVFQAAGDAVAAAADGQRALAAAEWPEGCEGVRVRMGMHTGEPLAVPPKYVGMDVHRAARIMAAGHGGQVVLSETTATLLDGALLRDLGSHRLKDMLGPIRLYQLEIEGVAGEFPPLRSLHQSNLPVAAWPLLGRGQDLARIRALVSDRVRLVTLTGPGGSGKTRLALQAAAELSEEFADGVFFVALAPVRQTEAVRGAVAEAVGLQPDDDVAAWIAPRKVLLILDNLEQLPGVDSVVAELLVGETVIIATSRTPLRLVAERELPVEPLSEDAAVELFVSRAAAAGRTVDVDETVAAVCRRLDNLPLALELAAARAKLLSPAALLRRLDASLPLLTGGASDRPERQRTLRATIEWSHDLLDPDAQAAFRRLSVFRGSFTLDAAQAVASADLDQLGALLDQSLLKPLDDDRFFMLETLREYAREQLDQVGETGEYALRHGRFYLSRLEKDAPHVDGPRMGDLLGWFRVEEDNLRAMLGRLGVMAPDEAARGCELLFRYWWGRAAYHEGRQQLRAILEQAELGNERRAALLVELSKLELDSDLDAADSTAREAALLADAAARPDLLAQALRQSAWVEARKGNPDAALPLIKRAAQLAESLDQEIRIDTLHDLGALLGEARRNEEARAAFAETMNLAKARGDVFLAVSILIQLGFIDLDDRQFAEAHDRFTAAITQNAEIDHYGANVWAHWGLGYALLGLARRDQAHASFSQVLDFVLAAPQIIEGHFELVASGIAQSVELRYASAAARLRGAIDHLRAARGWTEDPRNIDQEHFFDQPLIATLGEESWNGEHAAGTRLTLDTAIQLARSLASEPAEHRTLD